MSSVRGLLVPVIVLTASARLWAGSPAALAGGPPPESSPSGMRVVIRGSGSNVRLEREAATPPIRRVASAAPAPILDDVVRMTKSGAPDPLLLSYLRAHARELPKVLSQGDLARLQANSVSETVVGFLIRTVAIDIGVTGEGRESGTEYVAGAPYLASDTGYAYPMDGYVSYGGSFLAAPRRFMRHHFRSGRGGLVFPPHTFPIRPHPMVTPPAVSNTILMKRPGRLRRGDGF